MSNGEAKFWLCLIAIGIFVVVIPGLIASKRKHAYKGIIWVLGIAGMVNGVTWLIAMIWALWPQEKTLTDPVLGNVTGTGSRNIGDVFGSAEVGYNVAVDSERVIRSELEIAAKLLEQGVISESEYQKRREKILGL